MQLHFARNMVSNLEASWPSCCAKCRYAAREKRNLNLEPPSASQKAILQKKKKHSAHNASRPSRIQAPISQLTIAAQRAPPWCSHSRIRHARSPSPPGASTSAPQRHPAAAANVVLASRSRPHLARDPQRKQRSIQTCGGSQNGICESGPAPRCFFGMHVSCSAWASAGGGDGLGKRRKKFFFLIDTRK